MASEAKYNGSLLNQSDNLPKYNNNYKKALNLGVYGTDLGYTNIYGQNQDGIKYISSIKSLADELNIGQFFDIALGARTRRRHWWAGKRVQPLPCVGIGQIVEPVGFHRLR